jgi:hypothetical protein
MRERNDPYLPPWINGEDCKVRMMNDLKRNRKGEEALKSILRKVKIIFF